MVTIRKPKNALKFSRPASWWGSTWREGLPTGNGTIGASVLGGACDDTIMINHSDLWWQGHVGVLQDVSDKLKDVRKKIGDGNPKSADDIMSNALITKGFRPQPAYPLPLCDFKVKMETEKAIKEYNRILNMENGEVGVTFKDGTTRYERSLFVSRAQGILVYEITKAGSKPIDVHFSLDMHDKFNARTPSAVSKLPDGINVKYENYFMYFSGRSDNSTEFGTVAFINHYGGSQTVDQNGITIKGADKILVLLKPFVETQREKAWKEAKTSLSAIKSTYDKLLKEHTPLHNKLFNSAELDLNADDRDVCADKLLDRAVDTGEMPLALLEKLWAYGRYLMITGTSPAGLPLAPYGLWCGDFKAQNSQITASGSMQSIYSHAMAGNLNDFLLSIFTYYESVISDLRKNATRLYGCRGIFVPSVIARGTGVLGSVESEVINFTGVAGWVSQLFYDYYRFTDDTKFLKTRALPFMKEAVMFYENFFKVQGDNMYESCPSYSPGTTPGNHTQNGETMSIARNSIIDFAIAKELLANLIEGSTIGAMNKSDIPKWKDMLERIPNYQVSSDNTINEYCDSSYHDNLACPSDAMFYPVYPGTEVSDAQSSIKKAFDVTLKKKFAQAKGSMTSPIIGRYANILARLGDGDTALDAITFMVRSMSMNNLVFAETDHRGMSSTKVENWASYTIEPNMSITNSIQEMALQSDSNSIKILPAMAEDMVKGSVSGLLTRKGVEITDLTWDMRKGNVVAKLKSRKATKVNISLPKGTKKVKPIGQEVVNLEEGTITDLNLPAGKVVTLDIKM